LTFETLERESLRDGSQYRGLAFNSQKCLVLMRAEESLEIALDQIGSAPR